ncbi:MAG: glycoside hydrolase family 15 protein, partial [Actinomycetota bacterium]|nr:glycoside hydrolase family 15 protein [Actinomycetota bacterium]
APGPQSGVVRHELRLGGFDAPPVTWRVEGRRATGALPSRGRCLALSVRGGEQEVGDGALISCLEVTATTWTALVVGVDADATADADALREELDRQDAAERRRLGGCRLPRRHPERALDALAVLRACTSSASGAVVASPTTSLPEAPGHDRQFDYRFSWLRDASLSTAVAALLGQGSDARRYLDFVHTAWGDQDLLTRPVRDVRGAAVPVEREVPGVSGWACSRPVRVGNGAAEQRQYDALGLFVEAVSVYVQVGGELDERTWGLVRRLADQTSDDAGRVEDSSGIWELRQPQPLVDGDLGRWLLLDRALWIARGWRPWTRRRHWRAGRDVLARRVLSAVDQQGLLPQAYGQQPPVPDASALIAVAFGLLRRDDPRAGRLVDALLARLGAGPYVYRYPPGRDDGFSGVEGAFLPMSFLAVTALAQLGRVEEAEQRLDRLCAALPRLLSEEVEPQTGQLLGNTPLVWSHAELARALYVLDAARRRERWGAAVSWAWRLQRYVRLRHDQRARSDSRSAVPAEQEDSVQTRKRPAGPPAQTTRPGSGGIGRGSSPTAEAVSDALRRGDSAFLDGRRRTAVLQTAAAASLAVVGLYQFGILRSVPEPSWPGLDADRVDASGEAYAVLHTPDATLGIASAGVSLVLAGMGTANRHQEQPWIPLALVAKSLLDAAGGVYLFAEQVTRHKRICSWCTVSAGLLLATVPAVLPEARAAWTAWRSR